jgi:hypothetical protein
MRKGVKYESPMPKNPPPGVVLHLLTFQLPIYITMKSPTAIARI